MGCPSSQSSCRESRNDRPNTQVWAGCTKLGGVRYDPILPILPSGSDAEKMLLQEEASPAAGRNRGRVSAPAELGLMAGHAGIRNTSYASSLHSAIQSFPVKFCGMLSSTEHTGEVHGWVARTRDRIDYRFAGQSSLSKD